MFEAPGDEKKLEELILYISERCANDPTFGAVKLNKILYFADFGFYGYNGKGITGVEYQKLPAGPAPRRLLPVRQRMLDNRSLAMQEIQLMSGRTQKRTVNLRKPELELFTGAEIAMVDSVIESLRAVDADKTIALSHEAVGWQVTKEGDTIPYYTAYFSNPPLTDCERHRARELQAQQNATAA